MAAGLPGTKKTSSSNPSQARRPQAVRRLCIRLLRQQPVQPGNFNDGSFPSNTVPYLCYTTGENWKHPIGLSATGHCPMDSPIAAELKEVLAQYSLGELIDYEKNERGFVNTAYSIYTHASGERHHYFLRKYKRGIEEQELIFEHSLIEHLVAEDRRSPASTTHDRGNPTCTASKGRRIGPACSTPFLNTCQGTTASPGSTPP